MLNMLILIGIATLGLLVSLTGVIYMANQQKQGSIMVSIGIVIMLTCVFLKRILL
jgi:VIT1/CCC1 family predicted Fe2+/Mn2+ transporter